MSLCPESRNIWTRYPSQTTSRRLNPTGLGDSHTVIFRARVMRAKFSSDGQEGWSRIKFHLAAIVPPYGQVRLFHSLIRVDQARVSNTCCFDSRDQLCKETIYVRHLCAV